MVVLQAAAVRQLQRVLRVCRVVQERLVRVDVVRVGAAVVLLPTLTGDFHHGAVAAAALRAAVLEAQLFLLKSTSQVRVLPFQGRVGLFLLLLLKYLLLLLLLFMLLLLLLQQNLLLILLQQLLLLLLLTLLKQLLLLKLLVLLLKLLLLLELLKFENVVVVVVQVLSVLVLAVGDVIAVHRFRQQVVTKPLLLLLVLKLLLVKFKLLKILNRML